MQLDWTPLREPIALPCTKGLDIYTRNVLSGVLNAAEHAKEWNQLNSYQDVLVCLDTIHVGCPAPVTIEQMMRELETLLNANLISREGWRFRLSGLLVVDYVDYKAQTQTAPL